MPCPPTPRRGGPGATLHGVGPGASAHLSWAASLPGSLKMVPVTTQPPLVASWFTTGRSLCPNTPSARTPPWKTSSRVLAQSSHSRDKSWTRHHVYTVKCHILVVLPTGRDGLFHALQPSYPPKQLVVFKDQTGEALQQGRLS